MSVREAHQKRIVTIQNRQMGGCHGFRLQLTPSVVSSTLGFARDRMYTKYPQNIIEFPAVKRLNVQASFSGGDITSDGGLLLLRQADRKLGLLEAVNATITDPRDPR